MPLKSVWLLLFLCTLPIQRATAQHPNDQYYPYAPWQEERQPLLLTDSTLFYRAVQGFTDLYFENTSFNLPYTAQKRRGQSFDDKAITFYGVPLSTGSLTAMRLFGASEEAGELRRFYFPDNPVEAAHRASVSFSDRNYLTDIRLSITQPLKNGWSGAMAVTGRTGRDMHVEGVFTNALSVNLRTEKRFGENHSLNLLLFAAPSMRGTRLSSVKEAFTLTDNPLYNPAWGFQNGKVRNSRVRRDFVPAIIASYNLPLSSSTLLSVSGGGELGKERYSALGWYNARTPMPDNYRYLPSYTGDQTSELAWREEDACYTQIDWDELIAQNRMQAGHAVFALEDRVERLRSLHLNALFTTELDQRITLYYGASYSHSHSRNYKQLRDLLGAEYITDIDQYLIDDDTYGNMLQNNLRNPDRTIRKGDCFGYDYALVRREAEVRFYAEYRSDRLRADAAAALGNAAIYRQGYYEKELFPDKQSLGRSRQMKFTPYTLRAVGGWSFSPRSYVELAATTSAAPANAADIFYQPLYNNRTIDKPLPERTYSASLNYNRTGKKLTLRLSGYYTATFDCTETHRYFDDISGLYSNMAVERIARAAYGIEGAADISLAYRWRLSLATSAGRFKYISDPLVTIISDIDNSTIYSRAKSRVKDCTIGGAPQLTACAEISHFTQKGWGFRLSAGYTGARYVEPAFLRRTERITRQAGITQNAFEQFIAQERLKDAFTLDAALHKTFYFVNSRFTASLMVRNILGDKNTIYNGYESLRVQRIRSGDALYYQPQATRYIYAYPRSFYLTVSYKF